MADIETALVQKSRRQRDLGLWQAFAEKEWVSLVPFSLPATHSHPVHPAQLPPKTGSQWPTAPLRPMCFWSEWDADLDQG